MLDDEGICRNRIAKELPMTTTYTAIFAEENGWIVGWVRELPGAIVQERTIEEARESLKEVIPLILATREAADETHVIARESITVEI
jgi:predicted RNase H-like HicB family nuclease